MFLKLLKHYSELYHCCNSSKKTKKNFTLYVSNKKLKTEGKVNTFMFLRKL
jgi:hypothetical protein